MKENLLKRIKKITSVIIALAVVVVGSFGLSTKANATEPAIAATEDSGVIYVQYADDFNYAACLTNNVAPEYTGVDTDGVGYFFGGWYDKVGNTYEPIKDVDALNAKQGTVVAKFVPAQTLSVKCQNWAGTTAESDAVIVRVISAVDSTNYSQYGFGLSKIVDGTETVLGTYVSEDEGEVYDKFHYYDVVEGETTLVATYEPDDLFGTAASHFTSCTLGTIPASAHGTIICIKPFWVTLDGTTVNGLSKFAHVEDGYLNYVNVPVNLNNLSESNGVAAGKLSIKSNDGLTFVGAEYGKVFDGDNMEHHIKDGVITCVGSTSVADGALPDVTTSDVFINLRFKKDESKLSETNRFYTFSVTDEEFCGSNETLIQNIEEERNAAADVWNIRY